MSEAATDRSNGKRPFLPCADDHFEVFNGADDGTLIYCGDRCVRRIEGRPPAGVLSGICAELEKEKPVYLIDSNGCHRRWRKP